ncbi:MAG: hypothetical protein BroJett011_17880 [Chloroflexota bacterium]|nr:MAG: hypothetical protein BroJett011_17880 [Chloroflexota bacterium]
MMMDKPTVFVRAKANKISVAETYSYQADIRDDTSVSFKEASGEIKVEFLYDGEGQDWRRRLHLAKKELFDDWKSFEHFSGEIQDFYSPRFLAWLVRGLKLLRLWRRIEKTLLGSWDDRRSFGLAAMSDAEKYSRAHQMAWVGYLTLQGYQHPNFEENWPENKPINLEIPIDNLEQKLAQSQKYELCFKYSLQKVEAPSVRLGDVSLTDEGSDYRDYWLGSELVSSGRFEELYAKHDEVLQLKIDLEVDGGPPQVEVDGKIPRKIIKEWWETGKKSKWGAGQKEDEEDKVQEKVDDDEEHPLKEQIHCMKGLCSVEKLAWVLKSLAKRGGYLLIKLDKPDDFEELKKCLLKAVFFYPSFVPIFMPYEHEYEELIVVPVPMLSKGSSDYRESHLYIKSHVQSNDTQTEIVVKVEDTEQLAKTLTAFANGMGGKISLSLQPEHDEKIIVDLVHKALSRCQPRFDWWDERVIRFATGKRGELLIYVQRANAKVYSVAGIVYRWEEGIIKELDINESYEFIKERCLIDHPLVIIPPVISFACIKWPNFDARESVGVRFDSQQQVIEWSEEIQFKQLPDHRFRVSLPLLINRPVELYRQKEITGQVHLELKGRVLSGLEVNYFDTLGIQRPHPQGGIPVIEKTSKVILNFSVMLKPIFQRKWATTKRQLEFDGILLDRDRLKDIQSMLADLGLENVTIERINLAQKEWRISFKADSTRDIIDHEYLIKARCPGLLEVTLHVVGQLITIRRERTEYSRLDRMSVQTGKMRITIIGAIRGESLQELSVLLNRLQQLLKERFNAIRFQVA